MAIQEPKLHYTNGVIFLRTKKNLTNDEQASKSRSAEKLAATLMETAMHIKELKMLGREDEIERSKEVFKIFFDKYKEDVLDLIWFNEQELIFNFYNALFCVARFYSGDKELLKDEVIHVKK